MLFLVNIGAAVVLVLAAPLILAVLGSQYGGGVGALRLIGLGLPFGTIGTLFAVTGFMSKKTWPIFFSQLASATIFLGGAYLAMRRFGIEGAAGAFLASEVILGIALAPVTIARLRALMRSGEDTLAEDVAAGERVLARGVAPVPVSELLTVARVQPSYDTGPMRVVVPPPWPWSTGNGSARSRPYSWIDSSTSRTTTRQPANVGTPR